MNKPIEELFVKTFLEKNVQERILFELSNPNKRRKVISRFSNPEPLLQSKYIFMKGKNLSFQLVENEISKYFDINKECYTMSTNAQNGKMLEFKEALFHCFEDYMTSILVCGENLVFLKTETGIGSPMKYILIRK